ncbi:hypothetical protein [Acinetobacter baumannii]|uniref:hypothetical protein n=1 Tax=Acinetobacter baumannii TaxID=470 RepID=UPI00338FC95A
MKSFVKVSILLAAGVLTSQYFTVSAQAALPDSCAKNTNGQYSPQFEIPCKALDDFLTTFNAKDELAWAKTLNYPHVRMSGNQVTVWQTPEAYAKDQDLKKLSKAIGWESSRWDYRYVVQSGSDGKNNPNKYHVALSFTRLDKAGNPIPGQTFDSFYIITKVNGKWGTQFRSSMAGSLHGKSAY